MINILYNEIYKINEEKSHEVDRKIDKYINDYQNDKLTLTVEKLNKIVKEDFICKERLYLLEQFDYNSNLVITDYFEEDFTPVYLIANRIAKPGPERVEDKYKNWWIKGFCTYEEWESIQSIDSWLSAFKKTYSNIETEEYDLDLKIIGAFYDKVSLDKSEIRYWNDKGLYIEFYGYSKDAKNIKFNDLLIDTNLGQIEGSKEENEILDKTFDF